MCIVGLATLLKLQHHHKTCVVIPLQKRSQKWPQQSPKNPSGDPGTVLEWRILPATTTATGCRGATPGDLLRIRSALVIFPWRL